MFPSTYVSENIETLGDIKLFPSRPDIKCIIIHKARECITSRIPSYRPLDREGLRDDEF